MICSIKSYILNDLGSESSGCNDGGEIIYRIDILMRPQRIKIHFSIISEHKQVLLVPSTRHVTISPNRSKIRLGKGLNIVHVTLFWI